MRATIAVIAAALLTPSLLCAQAVPIRFSFDAASPATGDAGAVIARRQQMRAWQDTVEVYLEQGATAANVRLAAAGAPANYLVSIVAMPLPRPGINAMVMAVAVFEPATLSGWRYLSHYVAYDESAQDAATALLRQTVEAINASRQPRR
jgi:hypothetical protein